MMIKWKGWYVSLLFIFVNVTLLKWLLQLLLAWPGWIGALLSVGIAAVFIMLGVCLEKKAS